MISLQQRQLVNRVLLSILFYLFIGIQLHAQLPDSVEFVNASWKTERIAPKIKLVTAQFTNKTLFAANQYISYVVIKNKNRKRGFNIGAESKLLKPVSDYAREKDATVVINGNFFDVKNGGSHDFVKTDGIVISYNKVEKGTKLSVHQKAAVTMQKGKLAIVKGNENPHWPDSIRAASVLANGPLLLFNTIPEPTQNSSFFTTRHPRTAVGITKKKNKVILLVADGRNENAAGLSIDELARIMKWLGCKSALNFDGGGSSTLWVQKRGVVNHPSDNKKWDHEGERKVANVLYFKR